MAVRLTVVGAGSWGTAIAGILATKEPTVLWARRPGLAETINASHENAEYLPGTSLPAQLEATADLAAAVAETDLLVMGVPSHGYRRVLERVAPMIRHDLPILSLSKGIEQKTLMRMTEVTLDVLPDQPFDHGRGNFGRGDPPILGEDTVRAKALAKDFGVDHAGLQVVGAQSALAEFGVEHARESVETCLL